MPKTNTPKLLPSTPDKWQETKVLVREHVERLVARYDDREQAESLVLLLDLIGNEDYDRLDREAIWMVAQAHAFTFTAAFDTMQDVCLQRKPQGTQLRMVS